MKILISSHTGNYLGGAEKSLSLFLKNCSFQKENIKVVIPHKGWQGDLRSVLDGEGFSTVIIKKHDDKTPLSKYILSPSKLGKRIWGILRFMKNYYFLLKRYKPDVIYLNTVYCFTDAIVGFLAGVPVVLHIRGLNNNLTGIRKIRLLIFGVISTKIITVDNESKRNLTKISSFFGKNLVYIPNGISLEDTRYDKKTLMSYKRIYKPDKTIMVGCIGTVTKQKNAEAFAQIANSITKKYSNVVFCWVGDYGSTPESEDIYCKIHEKHKTLIDNRKLIFTGYQANPYDWIALFDIFLFLSKKEGMSRVLLETMTLKRLVICFAIDGNKDLIINDKTGYLISPYDYPAMEEKIEDILQHGIPKSIIQNAYNLILNDFTQLKVTRMIERTLVAACNHVK